MHRLRWGNPETGPMFPTGKGTPVHMNNLLSRLILPALNRCLTCHKPEGECDQKIAHTYERDSSLPEWHGWHACRRGLGSNLNRLGVSDVVIQRILRHANVSTTMAFYVKSSSDDVRRAMTRSEKIFIGPKTILTPSARDLGMEHEVFVETEAGSLR